MTRFLLNLFNLALTFALLVALLAVAGWIELTDTHNEKV